MPSLATRRSPLLVMALVVLSLVPAYIIFRLMNRFWVPVPLWDEWATPGELYQSWCNGTLTLRELFSQHNESRKFFPRLLYLALAKLSGWDVRNLMLLTFAMMLATVGLFYRLLRTTPGATARSALVATAAAALLVFAPGQLENFLWGIQIETFFPGCAVVAIALINLSRLSVVAKALLNGALALVATYTAAHGMLLWVIGVPLLASGESWRRARNYLSYAGYFACAAIAIGGYFIGYARPVHHPKFFANSAGVFDYAHYLALWVGSYFPSPYWNTAVVGVAVILLALALVVAAFVVIRQSGNWRAFYAGFIIAAYAGATAAITALGRIGFGVEQAVERRYRTFNLFVYLAVVALLFALDRSLRDHASDVRRRLFRGVCAVLAIALICGWVGSYSGEVRQQAMLSDRNHTLKRALEWMEVIPDNPDLLLLLPTFEHLLARARVVRDHKLLRLSWVDEELAQKARAAPPLDGQDPFSRFETCTFDSNHNLWITGLAWLPERKRRADCVLIGAIDVRGVFKPISVMETGVVREELRGQKQRKSGFARTFNPANVPPGDVTIAAWAVDLKNRKLHPIGGAKFIPAHLR